MRKMKLELEALEVESFTTGSGNGVGTVRGHDSTDQTYCGCQTEQTGDYCVATDADGTKVIMCQPTVAGTCHGPTCDYGTCNDPTCKGDTCGSTCEHTFCDMPCTL